MIVQIRLAFFFIIVSGLIFANTNRYFNEVEDEDKSNKFIITSDIEWASPSGFSLTMDIYTPETGKENYPVLIIFHGGGWLINDKSPMTEMSEYIVKNSEYVVCNVNYRLLVDLDNTVKMNEMVEDVMGAVLWVKEHISDYNGDSAKISVTGDSAGGHLAAMIVNSGIMLESDGFNGNTFGFNPSYIPDGKTAEEIAHNDELAVQAVILSYAAFDIYGICLNDGLETPSNMFWAFAGQQPRNIFGNEFNVYDNNEMYKAVSPVYNIPNASERKLPPHLCTVGTADNLITPASVKGYVAKLKKAGHSAEYWQHEGRPHAFLDGGSNPYLGTSFEKDAPPAIDRMIEFLDSVFN